MSTKQLGRIPTRVTLTALLAAAFALLAWPGSAQTNSTPSGLYSESWAVVIGINDYQHPRVPKLRYAVSDARAVEQTLLTQSFPQDHIIRLLDREATKARIETVLGDELRQKVGPNDRVLVFFAGHGMTDRLRSGEEEGYLIPADGDPGRLFGTAVSMTALRQISDRLRAKHILYVVDACYSGYAFFNRSISTDMLEEMARKPAIQILTAGRQGDQAAERGGHGVFTDVFVRGLRGDAFGGKGWLALEELGIWMKERVFAESNRLQLPQFGNLSGEGQFVFLLPETGRATGGDEGARLRERLQTAVAVPPPSGDPPRGRLLYELDLQKPPRAGDVAQGNPAFDRVSFLGRAVEFKVSRQSYAVVQVPGEFADFVAEARITPVRGDGYFALQFHLGPSAYHAIRVVPAKGTLLVTLAPTGRHRIEDERQLSDPVIRIPVVRHGEEAVLTAVARGEEIVAYTNGVEAARASDRSTTRGALEFAVGTFLQEDFVLHLKSLKVWSPSAR